MRKWMLNGAMAATLTMAAAAANAQACQGFEDVLQSNTLVCPAVEWVKNRGITAGCDATHYCPNNAVTRAQMAIFLQRAGKALSPEVLSQQVFDDGGGAGLVLPGESPAPAIVRCLTPATAATVYPRVAVVNATISALSDGNPAGFRAFLLVRESGGSFANFAPGVSIAHRGTALSTAYGSVALTEQLALQPGTGYEFAVGIRRDNGGPATTGNFETLRCQITAIVQNRNGAASPLDPLQ